MEIVKLIDALNRYKDEAGSTELVVKVKDKSGEVVSDIAFFDLDGSTLYIRLEPVK